MNRPPRPAGKLPPVVSSNTPGLVRRLLRSADLRPVLPGLIVSSLLANVLALAMPLALLQILDRIIINRAYSSLAYLTVVLLFAIILEQVLRSVNNNLTSWLGARFEHQATMGVLDHLFRVPLRRYLRTEPSAYAEQLRSASQVAAFYSGQAALRLLDLPFVVIFLGLIYVIGGPLVLVPIVLLGFFTIATVNYGRSSREQVQMLSTNNDRRSGFLFEVLAGIHSVKTMMMENAILRRYEMLQRASAEQSEKLTYSNDRADRLGHYFSQIMVIGVVFFGGWQVIDGAMTPGGLAACLILAVRSVRPLRQGLALGNIYHNFVAADQRLQDLLNLPVLEESGKPPLPPIEQGLTLQDVEVCYVAQKPVFSGVNLHIPKGACIAIRGESGAGKTTLLNLLSGLEQPDVGQVLVDGRPLSDFAADSVHRQIALLPEVGTVVTGTILENLTLFDERLNERALAVATELGLDKAVASMKLGYETPLGENASTTIPLGTRQLITIVRTLARDPSVILFDEANIALDMESDRVLRQYLERVKGQKTIVLVTYRPSYVALADRQYSLVEGRLVDGASEQIAPPMHTKEGLKRPAAEIDAAALIEQRFIQPTDLSRCLFPLLHQLGWRGHPRELAEALPHMQTQLDLSGFFDVLANLNYLPQSLGRRSHEPDDRLLPYLYLPERGGAQIVVERDGDGLLLVYDGLSGEEQRVRHLKKQGDYYIFREIDPASADKTETSWVAGVFQRFQRHRQLILMITALTAILSLAPPLFTRAMWDRVIPLSDIESGAYLLIGFLMAIAIGWTLSIFKSRLLAYVGSRAEYILGISLMQRLLGLPSTAVEGTAIGRQVRRIRGLERLREYLVGPMALLAFDLPATVLLVIAVALINPWMVVVLGISLASFALTGFIVLRKSAPIVAASSRGAGTYQESVDEALNIMRLLRQTGARETWLTRLRGLSAEAALSNFQERKFNQRVQAIAQILGNITGLVTLIASTVLAMRGEITGGTLIATQIITWRITGPFQNLFLAATAIVRTRENIKQIDNLMRLPKERDRGTRQTVRPRVRGELEFARVSFRYANDQDPALLGVNFTVAPTQCVAVTGPDGSGKTTLLKLILRLHSPQAGSVRLDHVDIRQLTTTDLRSQISYMPQNCDVFYGTIEQNLRFVHPAATPEEMRWALEMAGLLEDVETLPEGLNTRISSSRADEFPRGFRQRLSLARTMLRPAAVVLMDEPGTGMDQVGEAALIRCIQWLRGRATLILVTLRPGHLRLADQAIYLERGRVSAIGPFARIEEKVMAGLR